jgi:glycogen debranching enzyme
MTSGGWDFGGESTALGDDTVTLVEGSSFCVSSSSGAIHGDAPQGVFYRDTRVIASWELTVDGEAVEPLAATTRQPHHATFLGRARPRVEGQESTLVVQRERYVGAGIREDIIVRNTAAEPAGVTVEVLADADFADLFAVKEGRIRPHADRAIHHVEGGLQIESTRAGSQRAVRISAEGAIVEDGRLLFREVVPGRGEWRTTLMVQPIVDHREAAPKYPLGMPIESTAPSRRLQEWTESRPVVWGADPALMATLRRTEQDLGSLRIFDPDDPSRAAVAAGAPWFMALFGRDSLLTAFMALPIGQDLALGTLKTLARYQGEKEDPLTEEQPGRILHEMRLGLAAALALGGGHVYYGTADATPLFVMLRGELADWGLAEEDLRELVPHADRALQWMAEYGDRDGDGFVEYQRLTDRGLRNQGWKDSWDGINFADGTIAEPPIALCEVQAYAYGAHRARARIAEVLGDEQGVAEHEKQASELKRAFNDAFWLPDQGWYAVGLDRDKRPIDALTSNIGHCLWTGIVDDDKAGQVAAHLVSDQMTNGWGVRTLGAEMGAYNPISYHNGSVWPHDNAIVAAGLSRYGFMEEAQRVAEGILAAARCFDGRLPELFTGLDRAEFPRPVDYPASGSPQAWAAATPLLLLRSLLRFDPALSEGKVYVAPAMPDSIPELHAQDVPLGDARLSLTCGDGAVSLDGLPEDVELVQEPRPVR